MLLSGAQVATECRASSIEAVQDCPSYCAVMSIPVDGLFCYCITENDAGVLKNTKLLLKCNTGIST
jgi:hypothetical protein